MNFLIIGTPRSGTTSLFRALSDSFFEFHKYFEPWHRGKTLENDHNIYGKHTIVKSLVYQKPAYSFVSGVYPFEWYKPVMDKFVKTILITRRNEAAAGASLQNSIETGNWFDSYNYPDEKLNSSYVGRFIDHRHDLEMIGEKTNTAVWYYEDLFFNDVMFEEFMNWLHIEVRYPDRFRDYFDPKYKLRVS